MSTQKNPRAHQERTDENLGLLANGSCGGWEVSVDETISGPNRWFVEIEGPAVSCSFEVPSPNTVLKALEFLQGGKSHEGLGNGPANKEGSLEIGGHPNVPVTLIRDDEYTDRYFLVIRPDTALARLSIAGQDLKDLTEALRQAVEDIEDDR